VDDQVAVKPKPLEVIDHRTMPSELPCVIQPDLPQEVAVKNQPILPLRQRRSEQAYLANLIPGDAYQLETGRSHDILQVAERVTRSERDQPSTASEFVGKG
jgi:hypothetical protein